MKTYQWAVLGCGQIAGEMAQAMLKEGRCFAGVASRSVNRAADFAKQYGVAKVYPNVEALLADKTIDIVYIATPNLTHSALIRQALQSGKHVLCEKSITLNIKELNEAAALARQRHLVLAEAMTIYHMPLVKQLKALIKKGELGRLRMIQLNFGSRKEYDPASRFYNPALGGGALLDIGVYALSFARWFMTSVPDQIQSQVRMTASGVDDQSGILLKNPQGEMATIALTFQAKQPKRGVAAFERGYIEVEEYPRADKAWITWTADGVKEKLEAGKTEDALRYEIQDMERAAAGGLNEMALTETSEVMTIMTALRQDWGLVYPGESILPD